MNLCKRLIQAITLLMPVNLLAGQGGEDLIEIMLQATLFKVEVSATFEEKQSGSNINVEIERGTQVIVDTVRDAIDEKMGALMPLFEKFLATNNADIDSIGQAAQKALSNSDNQ